MGMMPYSASGDPPPAEQWKFIFPKTMKFIESGTVPKKLPPWLTEADLDFFAGEFKRAGFRGGIYWARHLDRHRGQTAFPWRAQLRQPAVLPARERAPDGKMNHGAYDAVG